MLRYVSIRYGQTESESLTGPLDVWWLSSPLTHLIWYIYPLPVLGVCPFLVDGFARLLFATWKSAPKWSSGGRFSFFSLTNLSLISLRGITIQPAGSLRSTTCIVDSVLQCVQDFYLNFLKIIEIGSTPYRYSARKGLFYLVFLGQPKDVPISDGNLFCEFAARLVGV